MPVRIPSFRDIYWDVVIIGGGISGYTAAYSLLEREPTLNIVLLEEQDRIGGRVHSVPLLAANGETHHYDMGGQWISKEQKELFILLNKLEIEVVHTSGYGKVIVDYRGKKYCKSKHNILDMCSMSEMFQLIRFIRKIEDYCSKLTLTEIFSESEFSDLDDVDMETFINRNVSSGKVKCILQHTIVIHCGIEAAYISVLFYIAYCLSTNGIANHLMDTSKGLRECWIKNGASQICYKIEERLQVRSGMRKEAVTEVSLNSTRYVQVETNVDTYIAHTVIIAVPPQDLQKINFSPPLYRTLPTIPESTSRTRLVKFFATYENEFWKAGGFNGEIYVLKEAYEEDTLYICHNVSTEDCAALTGYLLCKDYTTKSDKYRATILEQLAKYFGAHALHPIAYQDMVWSSGPFLTCSIQIMDRLKVAQVPGRLFLAGAETSPRWYGCIAGAVESGKRAAIEALYAIRPGILTVADLAFVEPSRRMRAPKIRRYRKIWLETLFSYKTYLWLSVILLGGYYVKRRLRKWAAIQTFLFGARYMRKKLSESDTVKNFLRDLQSLKE